MTEHFGQFRLFHSLLGHCNDRLVKGQRIEIRGNAVALQKHQSRSYCGAFIAVKIRLRLRDMETIRRRYVDKIALTVTEDVLWMNDGAFQQLTIAHAMDSTEALNGLLMKPVALLDSQKARLVHEASIFKRLAWRFKTRSATLSNAAVSIAGEGGAGCWASNWMTNRTTSASSSGGRVLISLITSSAVIWKNYTQSPGKRKRTLTGCALAVMAKTLLRHARGNKTEQSCP